jgi:acyl-CoA synthetase (AMP-forming)/AMP-acid ligase II
MTGKPDWPVRNEPPTAASYRASGAWRGRTLADDARDWAQRAPDATIFLGEDAACTYATILADAMALGQGLRQIGVGAGETVSFMIPNWREAAVINLAACAMGFVINPIVPIYRDAETRFILRNCRSRAIFLPGMYRNFDYGAMLERLRPDLPDLRHVIAVRGAAEQAISYDELRALGRGASGPTPDVSAEAVKMVMYTSGTTGAPKAVLHSHNTLARAVQAGAALWQLEAGDAVLMPSPVTHVSGFCNGLESPFLVGTRTVLMESWNADEAVDLIDRHRISMTIGATPFLQELVQAALRRGSRLESLRIFACGGAPVPPALIRRANDVFANACAFRVYGSSEAPLVSLGKPDSPPALASETDGRITDYEVLFLDQDGNETVEGEIAVRGPALFLGYGNAAQTRDSFTPEGFFLTGDIGRIGTEGGLVITGRKKDLIIRGGENISSKEIEDVLHQHPDIIEAAVVAAPHPRLGEGVFAFLITREGRTPDLADIAGFLTEAGLAKQKSPEGLRVVADLPRTASGKVRKDQLRALLTAEKHV